MVYKDRKEKRNEIQDFRRCCCLSIGKHLVLRSMNLNTIVGISNVKALRLGGLNVLYFVFGLNWVRLSLRLRLLLWFWLRLWLWLWLWPRRVHVVLFTSTVYLELGILLVERERDRYKLVLVIVVAAVARHNNARITNTHLGPRTLDDGVDSEQMAVLI